MSNCISFCHRFSPTVLIESILSEFCSYHCQAGLLTFDDIYIHCKYIYMHSNVLAFVGQMSEALFCIHKMLII